MNHRCLGCYFYMLMDNINIEKASKPNRNQADIHSNSSPLNFLISSLKLNSFSALIISLTEA